MLKKYSQKRTLNNLFIFSFIIISIIKSSYSLCNKSNCPESRGICSGGTCICKDNYITVNNALVNNKGIYCNYPVKSRLAAVLLEFFFPFGVGHFYSGNTLLAIIKLALFIILLSMCCSILCCVSAKMVSICSSIIVFIVIITLILLVGMEIFDLVGYGLGIYNDGNGIIMR